MAFDWSPTFARIHRGTDIDASGCWIWRSPASGNGYGAIKVWDGAATKQRIAHRVAYEAFVGPIPAGLEIDHLCRNRRCCNPEHLEAVTHAENMRRSASTHCQNGHPRNPAHDRCRVCRNIRRVERRRQRKLEVSQ